MFIFSCSLFKSKPNKQPDDGYKYLSKEVYNNENYDYSVLVPKSWTSGMKYDNTTNVRFDDIYSNAFIIIIVNDIDSNHLIEECREELDKTSYNFKIDKIVINKVEYDHMVYTNDVLDQSVFITNVNDQTYLIICFVPPNTLNLYEDLFVEFISSITFPVVIKGEYKENIS